ncbi:MAG: hypothetical protein DMD94_26740 [Candidatus Rokuibacteriota bacterium]|nr:MAG: hypothetical protein DMD94_26740 [Candidatus Rokubacteria bacterium]
MAVQTTRTAQEMEEYCARLRAAGLDAPWSRPGPLIPPKPTATQPRHWRWRDIEPLLRESSEFLSPHRGAERRVLRLHNPGVPERTVAHSLVLAIQYLLPGEVAPAHRHSPTAIRFMLHGEGAFTTVDGQKCAMKPGDLVLTPGMAWHDHGNEGGAPVYWMDILDWQIVRFLENLTFEPYPNEQQSALRAPGRDIYFPWSDTYGETSCAVYRVVRGRGVTTVDDQTFEWEPGDFFVIPPRARHAHANAGSEPAVLFTAQDVPLLKLLRLYHMEEA